jgi:hypothetical protein
MANALDVLREMHVAAKSAFQDIEGAAPDKRSPLWAKLKLELKLHEQIEERFIYKPMSEDINAPIGALAGWDAQHEAQVSEAESMMNRIDEMEASQPAWLDAVKQLKSTLEQHIEQEETKIRPEIQRQWGEDKLSQRHMAVEAAKVAGQAGATVSGALEKAAQAFR